MFSCDGRAEAVGNKLKMDPQTIGIIGIAVLFVLLIIGMPIGVALAFVGFWGISLMTDISVALPTMLRSFLGTFTTYSFTVIPLFVIMGELATVSGLSQGIYAVADKWLRRLPGGLAIATIGACSGFAAICGSSVATAATLGRVALPEMEKYDYDVHLATGSVAAGGTLGFLIPPSIGFVVYGILTEQSIGKLLISGFIPGFLLALTYIIIIVIWVMIKPDIAPFNPERIPWREKIVSLFNRMGTHCCIFSCNGGYIFWFFFRPPRQELWGLFSFLLWQFS